jgi:hypothetical protein
MMTTFTFIDVAPNPVGIGIVAAVVLTVVGFVILLAAGLILFLWWRKRRMRHQEMVRHAGAIIDQS